MNYTGKWIRPVNDMGDIASVFRKKWQENENIRKASLLITALGVYEAKLNGKRVGEFVLAPGWTVYEKRLQYQQYDITDLLAEDNELTVTVGKGWFRSSMPDWPALENGTPKRIKQSCGLFAEIRLYLDNGEVITIPTDDTWECGESPVRFSEIYDGETFDAGFKTNEWQSAKVFDWPTEILMPQEGEEIREQKRVAAKEIIITPKGEVVVDFGQEVTGYVEFTVNAKTGEKIKIHHAEVLDKDGNFYTDNYRGAKAEINYICRQGEQTYHPKLTFFGFRYIRLAEFPGEPELEQFTAIAVCSDIKQTGQVRTSDAKLNKLFANILWGQADNFLDVPTDCPQRDERLGWTGDAQVFVKAASYNFDVEKFFTKWLNDVKADQLPNGGIPHVVPDYLKDGKSSAAWGDVATIAPWQIYLTYGNTEILKNQFASMKKWVDYISDATREAYLWTGGEHFGDWLGLDAPSGSYKGSTREDFIASAFYAYSTELLIKAGNVIGENVEQYVDLYSNIVAKFRARFSEYKTQTEYVLAVHFRLAEDLQKAADELAGKVKADGMKLQTGFVGTPYLLHVLSDYGHEELAYSLLLREEYPSWLFSVNQGATTVWEHWDGIMENGDFWSADMNSFNHYAYGAVIDWVYEVAAGIKPVEAAPGFAMVQIAPKVDKRLKWLEASLDTRHGRVRSAWYVEGDKVRYEIETPVEAKVMIGGKLQDVKPGRYIFWA